jgi:uncharacterized protein (TIGR03437 family)
LLHYRVTTFLLMALSMRAAEFQTGQAARGVIGQSSFSAHEAGVSITALSLANGKLYAADASRRILTFDLTRIPGAKDDLADRQGPCAVCGFAPVGQVNQPVLPGVAGVSVFGNSVAIADTANHRVLFWRNSSLPEAVPIFVGSSELVNPVSVAVDGKHLFIGDAALHRVLVWNSVPSADQQPPDAVLGQNSDSPAADSISRPAALASDGTNLFVADNVERRILVFTAGDAPLGRNAVANSASLLSGPLAPGTLVTISGAGLSESSTAAPDDDIERLPVKLGGVEVLFNGVALPLLSVSPTQVRAQLPYETGNASAGSLYVRTERSDGSVMVTNAIGLRLASASPGLFAFGGAEPRSGMILHAGDSEAGTPVTADDPAKPGEVLTLWAAGLGAVESEKIPVVGAPYSEPDAPVVTPIAALVAGRSAEVLAATLPHGAIGVYELHILVPADLTADREAELLIVQDGSLSNTITIPIQGR